MFGLASRKELAHRYTPAQDYGFFGPDSVTWTVWAHPTSYLLGFMRAVTIEHLDPNLAAAVVQSGGVKARPHTRYQRTMQYFAMAAFGASAPTAKAADILVKVHSKAIGYDPVTGGRYDANDPDSQLWIHVTAWHSILYCYEKFGPGKLTSEQESQYWQECACAAQLQTINPEDVPRSREEVRAYFEKWRPDLKTSEDARDMIDFILHLEIVLPPELNKALRLALMPALRLFGKAVVSTYPRHIRALAGVEQSAVVDGLVLLPTKAAHLVLDKWLSLRLALMELIAPAATATAAPAIFGIPPQKPVTMTPREAQELYGYDIPSAAHHDVRAKQAHRVFDDGVAPSDAGLIESQELIGQLA